MSRPRTDDEVRKKVWELVQTNPTISAGKIRISIRAQAKQAGIQLSLPTERTIARIKKDFLQKPQEERMPWRQTSWPETMELGGLPWEASRAMLDLVKYFHDNGWETPTIRTAQWFWRVALAAPDLGVAERFSAAHDCSIIEASTEKIESPFRGMELYLALSPWQSKKETAAYQKLVKSGDIPSRRPKGISTSPWFMVETMAQFNPKTTKKRRRT